MHPSPLPREASARSRASRSATILGAASTVLLLHALAIEAVAPAGPPTDTRRPAMHVRSLEATERLEAFLPPSATTYRTLALAPIRPLTVAREPEVTSTWPATFVAADATVSPSATASAPGADAPLRPEVAIPVYRAQLPPPMTLAYELRSGGLSGNGELAWRPSGDRYELKLEGRVAGITVLTQTSAGGIDRFGISPVRYTDKRARRGAQAANFERDKGLVSFSGSPARYEWVPGAQDRLTWMLQLGAVLAADPGKARAGQAITLYVVGARGEADEWVFDFAAFETVGAARAAKFVRAPRRPHDSHVEVWLDTGRQHAPLRARQWSESESDAFELVLRRSEPTP